MIRMHFPTQVAGRREEKVLLSTNRPDVPSRFRRLQNPDDLLFRETRPLHLASSCFVSRLGFPDHPEV